MRIIVLGAGHVGQTLVQALHEEHELTVVDADSARLEPVAERFDVRTVVGDGTTRRVVRKAGIEDADLLVACSPREEANLVCAILAKRMSGATTVVRATSMELLEAWREGELEVDFMLSPELETANAIAGIVGLPAARQTDIFAEGRVQVVEFDVPPEATHGALVGPLLRDAALPRDSKVASLIRAGRMLFPHGGERILPGDRVVVIGSPESARKWSRILARGPRRALEQVVIFGAGQMGTTIARVLLEHDISVRLVDADLRRAQACAERLPGASVLHADAFDADFLERQRVAQTTTVFGMNDDARNLFGAVLAKVHGAPLTITLVHDPAAAAVYERAGVDVALNPRAVTAEEIVRFAHDPRTRQVSMLEGDRCEILDITVSEGSELTHTPMTDMPETNAVIGAVVRGDDVIFPHGSDVLEPGDRVIVFVESADRWTAERVL